MSRPPLSNDSSEWPPDLPDDHDLEVDDEPVSDASGELDLGLETEATPQRLKAGVEVIQTALKTLPNAPGVYRMIDGEGAVLYVGKAKSLKKRVSNYARGVGHTSRIARMIAETAAMEFVTTETETEALLLEANYIKQLKPRFNVLLRDDKSFPYILVTSDHVAPQLTKHRGARARQGHYFGPFASVWAVNRTIAALQRAFLLRTCTDSYYENRSRPCLLYQIKRCAGPCTGEIDAPGYQRLVTEARDFLSGKSQVVKAHLAQTMQAASDALDFETAARIRDRLAALSAIVSTQDINPQTVEEADVFALHEEAGQFCIEVFFFRNYQNWGNRAYYPRADKSIAAEEILAQFVAQFYDDKPAPRLVLLSHDIEDATLLADALSLRAGHKIDVTTPKRGEKRDLVDHAATNAREALSRRLSDTASQKQMLNALMPVFGLSQPPRRVEIYDNSHIMGTNAVGAMVVAGAMGFSKPHYRTFNIKSEDLTPGDDFGMMREVLTRRFARLQKDSPRVTEVGEASDDAMPDWPDLVLIDGGKGQLEAARSVLAELGINDVPLAGVAKGVDRDAGREQFFIPGRDPFRLPPREPALYFIQRLRDEAHRFAIGTHRARRKKAFTANPLDEIPGIGPRRKRALLLHFGTAKAIAQASFEDLTKAPGVNESTAKAVYDFFHDGGR